MWPDSLVVPEFARIHEYAGPWLVYPQAFQHLWDLASRLDLFAHVRSAQMSPAPVRKAFDTIETRNGKRLAQVTLAGPMMKGQSSLAELGMSTSTIAARRAIRAAAADPEISGILLALDSPGGTVAGTQDLATDVKLASRKKPVIAHVDDLTASAAYWVASQADEVWANTPTALVGSVGTLVEVTESVGRSERLGVRQRVFSTGPMKAVGADHPITDEQAAYLQNLVDTLQQEFDGAVKKGRRLSAAQMNEIRSGAIYPATRAMELGLINGIRPLDQTIEALSQSK